MRILRIAGQVAAGVLSVLALVTMFAIAAGVMLAAAIY